MSLRSRYRDALLASTDRCPYGRCTMILCEPRVLASKAILLQSFCECDSFSFGYLSLCELKMECEVKCLECGKCFTTLAAHASHMKWIHERLPSPPTSHQCVVCHKSFQRSFDLKRHVHLIHEKGGKARGSGNFKCTLCECDINKKSATVHFEEHGYTMESEILKFIDSAAFELWKMNIEKETNSKFVKQHGKVNKEGIVVNEYCCHRSGHFKSRSKGVRALKVRGSNKIDSYCPAAIVTQSSASGEVTVNFQKTHIGHMNEVGRLWLSKGEKTEFASKIALGVPLEDILDEIGTSIEGTLSRRDLTTRKDLHNIIKTFNLNNDGVLHSEDCISVDSWVAHMKRNSNFVKLYKPQGCVLPECPQLDNDDFCLILANDCQIELLKKYGNDVICADGTHGTNGYNFQLYTILVLDDLREGFPCAFMVSSRGDTVAMQVYFRAILNSLNNETISPKWFMSDMDDCFYNAWIAVFGPGARQLYCSWHVDNAWKKNLHKIEGKINKIAVYKKIKTLLFERDVTTFELMKNHLRQVLGKDDQTKDFAKYLDKFFSQCDKWAHCHRANAGINTNMALENLHRNLKHIYLKGKTVKRLDKGIHALMRFLNYRMRDRLVAIYRGKLTQKLSVLRMRHRESLSLSEDQLLAVGPMSWSVASSSSTELYSVSKNLESCSCDLRCNDCDCCIHVFNCTCADASILWNMCKHIHLVCRIIQNVENVSPSFSRNSEAAVPCAEASALVQQLSNPVRNTNGNCNLEKQKASVAAEVLEIIQSVKSTAGLEALKRHLAPLQFIINAAEDKTVVNIPQLASNIQDPPNKKVEPQRKFYSTKRKSVSKKLKMSNPSSSEREEIKFLMVTGQTQDYSVDQNIG